MRIISAVKAKKIADKYKHIKSDYKEELKSLSRLIKNTIVNGKTSCTKTYFFIDKKTLKL